VSAAPVNEIVQGRGAITADTALRLGRYFRRLAPVLAQNLQTHFDLAKEEDRLGERLDQELRFSQRHEEPRLCEKCGVELPTPQRKGEKRESGLITETANRRKETTMKQYGAEFIGTFLVWFWEGAAARCWAAAFRVWVIGFVGVALAFA